MNPSLTYNLEEVNHALVQAAGRPRTVLDVGCGTGVNGEVIRRSGAHVTGIERSAAAAAIAKQRLDEVIELDLLSERLFQQLANRRFDLIVFGDVLEHVAEPLEVLSKFTPLLEDGGHVIVSLPNVAAWPIRLKLLRGDFSYDSSGILDRTHLRFFTQKSALELVQNAGLEVLHVDNNPMLSRAARDYIRPFLPKPDTQENTPTSLNDLPSYQLYSRVIRPIEQLVSSTAPGPFAFQHIIVARKAPKKQPLSLVVGMLSYNEQDTMGAMIDDIRKVAPDAQILVVDSSSDQTAEIAQSKGATVLKQLPPQGHGPAMELLMTEASKRADALIYLDCDFTYPVEHIVKMRRLLEEGADVVNGCRTRTRPEAMPLPNFLANRFFAATVRAVNAVPTYDVHSGMRAYRSSVIRAFAFDGSGDALPLDTLIWPARAGYHVVEYPIPYNERIGVSKLQKVRGTVWTFIRVAKSIGKGQRPKRYDVEE